MTKVRATSFNSWLKGKFDPSKLEKPKVWPKVENCGPYSTLELEKKLQRRKK